MIMYHYTSISTLLNILNKIKHKPETNAYGDVIEFYFLKFHASHAMFLNDPTENKFYIETLLEVFDNSSVLKSVITTSKMLIGAPYVLSFSELEDDLNMWVKYADNAQGVTLGFELNEKIIEEANIKLSKFSVIQTLKCEYPTKDKLIETIIKEDYQKIKNDLDNVKDNSCRSDNIVRTILCNSLKYKDIAYESEVEKRIAIFANLDSDFKSRKNEIVNYKEVKIPLSALKQIIFAPLTDFNKLEYSVTKLISMKTNSTYKGHIKISKSNIPYSS